MPSISYIKSSNRLAAKRSSWRAAIGRFILGFGEVEWFTFHMLSELPSERILESTMSLPFAKRADIIIEIAKTRNLDQSLKRRLAASLQKAKKLAETRNLVAHNPLLMDFFTFLATPPTERRDVQYQISKYGQRHAKLTFEALEAQCRELEALIEELYRIREEIDVTRAEET